LYGRGIKSKVRNLKIIPNEACVPKHKLLERTCGFTQQKRRKKFEPRICVWKLKEEQTCKEYKSMVRDKVVEEEWKYLDINEHWQKMKKDNDGNSTADMWNIKRSLQT